MNKKLNILLHAAIWGVLFLSPLSYLHRGDPFDYLRYVMLSMGPVALMIVFYTNYLWLTPHYYMRHERRVYWLVNIIMILLLGIAVHYWLNYADDLTSGKSNHCEVSALRTCLYIIRHVFNLCVAAAIATTIQLAQGWRKSEEARLEAESARTDAELRNLRSQINPHFLLNTLNNIYALTSIDQTRAQEAIQQLSKMLRHMLYNNQQDTVALKDEVLFIENYVNLMKIRLPKNVEVSYNNHVKKPDLKITPLIFISLVENAFKHGVSPTEPSFINITLSTDIECSGYSDKRDVVCCRIENSNHPKTSADRSGHGIGLNQVQRRLDLCYHNSYTWTKGPEGENYISELRIKC